ncbi:hypothetical protein HK405_004332, partial [Cladochytrium tenue]
MAHVRVSNVGYDDEDDDFDDDGGRSGDEDYDEDDADADDDFEGDGFIQQGDGDDYSGSDDGDRADENFESDDEDYGNGRGDQGDKQPAGAGDRGEDGGDDEDAASRTIQPPDWRTCLSRCAPLLFDLGPPPMPAQSGAVASRGQPTPTQRRVVDLTPSATPTRMRGAASLQAPFTNTTSLARGLGLSPSATQTPRGPAAHYATSPTVASPSPMAPRSLRPGALESHRDTPSRIKTAWVAAAAAAETLEPLDLDELSAVSEVAALRLAVARGSDLIYCVHARRRDNGGSALGTDDDRPAGLTKIRALNLAAWKRACVRLLDELASDNTIDSKPHDEVAADVARLACLE